MKKIFFGYLVDITLYQAILEEEGIESVIKDEYHDALSAGFGAGVLGMVDLYVLEDDSDRATLIIENFIETLK